MSILKVRLFLSGFAIAVLLPNILLGQIGNDNPTGPAGAFNGNVTTAGSYDPYTGNVVRKITDIVVAGGVGSYPLAFTRTSNSRSQFADNLALGFAEPGMWRHSYDWKLDYSEDTQPQPTQYSVYFPDGRSVVFSPSSFDTCFRGLPGVRERFQPLDLSTMLAYLILPDGGKIEFSATQYVQFGYYIYTYRPTAIIDPYGLRTSLAYNLNGRLATIQEPGGRWLQLTYVTVPWANRWGVQDVVIDHVQASDGRVVKYNYALSIYSPGTAPYTQLANVVYPSDPAFPTPPTAYYTYQAPNIPDSLGYYNGYPLLYSCDDPMYGGPMKKISYTFAAAALGQIASENYFDGANTGAAVSTLTVNAPTTRTETRGDGPSRTLNYDSGKLINFTDFKGHISSITYDGNGYVSALTNARGKVTTTLREPIIGAISVLTHPDPEQSNQRFAYKQVDGAPYFLEIRGDERNFNSNTYFDRDPVTNRVMKIWYPDYDPNNPDASPSESFTYNQFGQVETHTLTSSGVKNFRYDARGLLYLSWPPATPSNPNPEQHPTRYFYYTSGPQMDRLWHVDDPFGNATWFEYNVRGQVTKVTHQDGSYIQNGYNADGTLAWTADENHPNASWNANERTRYTYDEYKRVLSVTNPMNETTTISYALDWVNPLLHTTGSVKYVLSPLGKNVVFDYDENFRKKDQVAALGTVDEAWTLFDYDEVGNLTSVQDPRGNVTTFGYDERNRRTRATNPYPFNDQITRWEYDTRSNLIKVTRPDLSYRRIEYDPMSRVIDTYGFANEHTHYERDLAGNIEELVDPKPATYYFDYDKMNRKIGATYPLDATGTPRTESWHYDWAGNLDQYTNPAGQIKSLTYDSRNRPYDSWWDSGGGPLISTRFDDASRLSSVTTNNGETIVSFGYDDANRQTWEEQTVSGFPTRRVETPRDAEGNRIGLRVPNPTIPPAPDWYSIQYDYTQRNQLWHIKDGEANPWFTYSYDPVGNMTKRQDVYGGVNDSTNIMNGAGVSQYDALNRPKMWEQTGTLNGVSNSVFAKSQFNYDFLGRLTASWRDEQADKGEWFGYNATGQLTDVFYNADGVSTGPPQNASRTVTYTIAPNTLNRLSMDDNGDVSDYTPNALNQYENVAGGSVYYDANFNLMWTGGFSAWHDSANLLRSVNSGENYGEFTYDGLGRCLKRTVDWETTIIAYDGWKATVEWDEWNGLKAWNIYGPGPDEILYRHDAYLDIDLRYHLDRMGNVAFLLDSDGEGIERYTYDAFGHPTVTDWNGENPRTYSWYGNRFMFTGREYFAGLGLYDFRHRFYHPVLGRFLQSDPMGFDAGDVNLFRYCGGDPVNGSDPFGLNGNDRRHDYDHNDQDVWMPEQIVNGYSILDDEYWQLWLNHSPLSDYNDRVSLFRDETIRLDNNPEPPAGTVTIGPTIEVVYQAPPGALPNEAFNPSGKGWVYGGQVSYYATLGGHYGSQTVVFANGQSAYYTYFGYGGGAGKWGVVAYEGIVKDVYWPSEYSGGFVSVGISPGMGYSLSPTNGAEARVFNYGLPGGAGSVESYQLQAVWWGH